MLVKNQVGVRLVGGGRWTLKIGGGGNVRLLPHTPLPPVLPTKNPKLTQCYQLYVREWLVFMPMGHSVMSTTHPLYPCSWSKARLTQRRCSTESTYFMFSHVPPEGTGYLSSSSYGLRRVAARILLAPRLENLENIHEGSETHLVFKSKVTW